MPNYCDCELTVSAIGSIKEFSQNKRLRIIANALTGGYENGDEHRPIPEAVLDRLTGKEDGFTFLDANKIIPYPQRYADMDRQAREAPKPHLVKDGYNSGGYEWCIKNWGTKWNFCDVEREMRPRSIFYQFQTAWSPPKPLIKKLGEIYHEFRFSLKYYEGGMGFQGKYVVENGKVVTDETGNYCGGRGG